MFYCRKQEGKTENKTSIAVSITNNSLFFVDKTEVSEANLENEILKLVGVDKAKTVVIRGDKDVPYKNVMKIIDIANRNKLKMILAVKGK